MFAEAGAALLAGAVPQGRGPGSNAFKIPMAQRAVVRALEMALAGQTSLLPGSSAKGQAA